MGAQLYFDNYSPVGDLTVIAMCFVIFVLLLSSYVNKTKAFGVYVNIVIYLMLAAFCDVFYHTFYQRVSDGNYTLVYIARVLYHAILFSNLLLYVVYIVELQKLERDKKIKIMILSTVIYVAVIGADIVTAVNGTGFHLDESGNVTSSNNVFLYGYLCFMVVIIFLLIAYRKRLFKRVMTGFYGTILISFWVLYIQGSHGQSSFTVATFLFPTVAMLYMIHANPYDIETGSVNSRALEDTVRYYHRRKQQLVFMSLLLPDFEMEGSTLSKELQDTIRSFSEEYFKEAVLFQVSNGHVILFARKKKNPDYEEKIHAILDAFRVEYEKFQFDYKIVMGSSIEDISEKNAYISFIRSIHQKMRINEVHLVEPEDVAAFEKYEYVLSELADICKKKDLRDPRVLAYCQPVYNLRTGSYDTAEALMRLQLPKMGIVYPDQFISLAEDNGYIHILTQIILQKTCDEIRRMLREGYEINRVSVNVSILEMREDSFGSDISFIIQNSGIPEEKIAIEITESQSENDFLFLKNRIGELRGRGIKFYLDDFGTGYSNMERILELPFDIIKFDKSLVVASDTNERSEKMVGSLASMFAELNYSVLYEGIETDGDERRCVNMSAMYLQGYKYSRPVPIEELRNFFSKAAGA